ncbi:formylglycine-generating enzyme family protein [Aureliella helgolandensis]|uniref:Serine/threonine-protein kinase pkn1 n=1 Tax=Aureliella helgolandensis TaxID=2527968 RepID=A0A518GG90_9BACT|nr:SUMF1/EgtB/PvdO family nonheme iron enzyme [Aureliella helgolandensis]QDV27615.1 Serine/threonine-protein kinase pkn1 [Aureliella helgolandensis]
MKVIEILECQRLLRVLAVRNWCSVRALAVVAIGGLLTLDAVAAEPPPVLEVEDASATTEAEMKPYREIIEQADVSFEMLPIPGGKFSMGSSEDDDEYEEDELPQHEVEVSPFWMAKLEMNWDVYDVWASDLDVFRRQALGLAATPRDALADTFQLSQPTKPYTDMTFGMGKRGYPAVCMTQHAARTFCNWLSAKTGRYYRLPTEAEWEYACRAGTTTAYSFGDDVDELEDYAWFFDNTDGGYEKVGKKKPNPWGLHDMHGNVAEWVLDQYDEAGYEEIASQGVDPLAVPKTLYPRVVRGGGWDQFPEDCRSAAREASSEDWKKQDPQIPKSIWYHTDALHVGFRVVRPLVVPTDAERKAKWDKSEPVQVERVGAKANINN